MVGIASAFEHLLRQLEILGGATERAFVLSVSTPLQRSNDETRAALESFMNDFRKPLEALMRDLEAER